MITARFVLSKIMFYDMIKNRLLKDILPGTKNLKLLNYRKPAIFHKSGCSVSPTGRIRMLPECAGKAGTGEFFDIKIWK